MAKVLIVGSNGEVGRAVRAAFNGVHEVFEKDFAPAVLPEAVDVIHICLRYDEMDHAMFVKIVLGYLAKVKSLVVDICSTVKPGTCEEIAGSAKVPVCHSTTRGLHPHINLRKMTKHIGGEHALFLASIYNTAGVPTVTHASSRTTELAHILNNLSYGANLALADEMSKICRAYGVDYCEAVVAYTQTNNSGFLKLGQPGKARPVLTPPNGIIGGHCVVQSANLLDARVLESCPIASVVTRYGYKRTVRVRVPAPPRKGKR